MKQRLFTAIITLGLLASLPASTLARDHRPPRDGAPPEAIAACKDKSSGDSVEFEGRHGDMLESTCQEVDGQLVAVPDNPPERGRGRPPR